MSARRFTAAALALCLFGLGLVGRAQDAAKGETPRSETFDTVDGVKLSGTFYKATPPKQTDAAKPWSAAAAPVVLILHSYKAAAKEMEAWDGTAKLIQSKGYHAFTFDFRGHGNSKDITPKDFFNPDPQTAPWAAFNNKRNIRFGAGQTVVNKNTLAVSEFAAAYYPMLVQDIAAARIHLDKKNDNGELNSSSIYLLGAGDAVNLGLLFTASEWSRERKRPNESAIVPKVFPGRRKAAVDAEWAGLDVRGAVWLSPMANAGIATADMKKWVLGNPSALEMRVETQEMIIYGAKDTRAATMTNTVVKQVLNIAPKDPLNPAAKGAAPKLVGSDGKPLPNPDQSFVAAIKDTGLVGTGLLGNNLGTENLVTDFIGKVEELRSARERTGSRGWSKPLYIDIAAYGLR
jgi:hypothetical protein